jgi:ribosome production factor 2
VLQVKNVGGDMLKGKVGRIYMPRQEVDKMALAKPKGLKRARREAAAEAKAAKTASGSSSGAAAADGAAAEQRTSKRQRGEAAE